jgi:hypothetical protein
MMSDAGYMGNFGHHAIQPPLPRLGRLVKGRCCPISLTAGKNFAYGMQTYPAIAIKLRDINILAALSR